MLPRTFPATCGVAGLLLATKMAVFIVSQASHGHFDLPIMAVAEPAHATEASPAPKPPQASGSKPRSESVAAHTEAAPSKPPETAASPVTLRPSDPPLVPVTEQEKRLLEDLRGRRQEWDARDHSLEMREAILAAAEQRLSQRSAELDSLQLRLEQLEKARKTHEEANWSSLVKVYETMRPQQAATIFNDMDMPVLLEIADRMREAKAALVLAQMQPDRARSLTTELATRRAHATSLPANGATP
jgi:flagellar motility protein MotE (MotC chaperone)